MGAVRAALLVVCAVCFWQQLDSHQPFISKHTHQRSLAEAQTQERFVICHDCVRNEPMCLGLWKTSTEEGMWWRNGFVVGVSDTTNGSHTLMWRPHPFVTKFMLVLTTTSPMSAEEWRMVDFFALLLARKWFLSSNDAQYFHRNKCQLCNLKTNLCNTAVV